MNDHIVASYDDELKEVRSIISRMGGLAADQLLDAMQALQKNDIELAKRVCDSDKDLDKLDFDAEETAIGVFARRAPVANDLRTVVSGLKITTMIERIGDYAKNIAKRSVAINEAGNAAPLPTTMDQMGKSAYTMIQDVMDAHAYKDPDAAVAVWLRDKNLDNLHNAAHEQILTLMMENPSAINIYSHYLMIAKNLERIGDQATNIAEQVYFTSTGKRLTENRPKQDSTSHRADLNLTGLT